MVRKRRYIKNDDDYLQDKKKSQPVTKQKILFGVFVLLLISLTMVSTFTFTAIFFGFFLFFKLPKNIKKYVFNNKLILFTIRKLQENFF